jgi:hypothetical protein
MNNRGALFRVIGSTTLLVYGLLALAEWYRFGLIEFRAPVGGPKPGSHAQLVLGYVGIGIMIAIVAFQAWIVCRVDDRAQASEKQVRYRALLVTAVSALYVVWTNPLFLRVALPSRWADIYFGIADRIPVLNKIYAVYGFLNYFWIVIVVHMILLYGVCRLTASRPAGR